MNKEQIAKDINYKGEATRLIRTFERLEFEVGEIIDEVGMSWTNGGEFNVENDYKYYFLFKCEEVEGHAVDYTNEEECYELSCEDCEAEKEILVSNETKFEVVEVNYDFDETMISEVILKVVRG